MAPESDSNTFSNALTVASVPHGFLCQCRANSLLVMTFWMAASGRDIIRQPRVLLHLQQQPVVLSVSLEDAAAQSTHEDGKHRMRLARHTNGKLAHEEPHV